MCDGENKSVHVSFQKEMERIGEQINGAHCVFGGAMTMTPVWDCVYTGYIFCLVYFNVIDCMYLSCSSCKFSGLVNKSSLVVYQGLILSYDCNRFVLLQKKHVS